MSCNVSNPFWSLFSCSFGAVGVQICRIGFGGTPTWTSGLGFNQILVKEEEKYYRKSFPFCAKLDSSCYDSQHANIKMIFDPILLLYDQYSLSKFKRTHVLSFLQSKKRRRKLLAKSAWEAVLLLEDRGVPLRRGRAALRGSSGSCA